MARLSSILSDPKAHSWVPLGLFAIANGALALALHAQFVLGLEPCILCLYQRIPYALIGLVAAVALIRRDPRFRRAVVLISAICFTVGAATAFYHVGVEQHWWASAVCGGDLSGTASTQELLAGLKAPPEKSCDQIDWSFLGLSMATYNVLFSGIMAGACLILVQRMRPVG